MKNTKDDGLSIATESKNWRQMSPMELKKYAANHPERFRRTDGGANIAMVEALGKALTPKEFRSHFPAWESFNLEDQEWNAAIAYLSQFPAWDDSKKAKPIQVNWNEVIGMGADEFAQFAIHYCYSKRVRGVT